MLIGITPLRACRVFLLSGLLLAAGHAISAQSVGKGPSQLSQPASQQPPQAVQPVHVTGDSSAKSQTPPEPVVKIADIVQMVEDEGRSTSISSYIAEGIGIKNTQIDSSPVQARVLSDTQRELCVIDDTGALLLMIKDGDTTVVYLANHAGVLQLAGYFYPGRFRSQEFKRIPKEKAAAGFAAEREVWIKKISSAKYGVAPKPEGPARNPDSRSVTGAGEAATPKTAAPAGGAVAVDEKDKLSQMTPRERIKYLNQQMREAKQEAKLEKKESAKKQKLDTKAAAQKPQKAPDNKSDAKSNQQSNNDSDAAPSKKKISWF